MGDGKGGGRFGFAPRSEPDRRMVGHRPPDSASREQPAPQPASPPEAHQQSSEAYRQNPQPHQQSAEPYRRRPEPQRQSPEAYPQTPEPYRQSSEKPLWLWLLIGILLGTGGTLLTSTLWLPEREAQSFAQPVDDDPEPSVDEVEEARASEAGPPAIEDVEASSAEPAETVLEATEGSAETQVAALDLDEALSGPLTNGVFDDGSGQTETASGSPSRSEPTAGTTSSAAASPSGDIDSPVAEADTTSTRSDSDQGSVVELPLRARDGDGESNGIEPGLGEPIDLATTTPDDTPGANGASPPRPSFERDQGPSADGPVATDRADPADLPPRIKQALHAADNQNGQKTGSNGSSDRVYRVQLAAVDNQAAAQVFWREVNDRLPGVFDNVEPLFNKRLVDNRLYFQIWVGSFDRHVDAVGYCSWLKEQGQDCFVTRTEKL